MLDPLLVATELILDLVNAQIHRRLRRRAGFSRDEIMLVLGRDQDLHVPGLLPLVDRDLDRHQAAEILQQLFGLIVQVTLLLGTQTTVTSRDLDLHPGAPCYVFRPAASSRAAATTKITPDRCLGQDHTAKIVPPPSPARPAPVPSRRLGTILNLFRRVSLGRSQRYLPD